MNNRTLPPIRLIGDSHASRIVAEGGRIVRIEPVAEAAEYLGFPLFHDLHVHANRSYSLVGAAPQSFEQAVSTAVASFETSSFQHYYERCHALFAQSAEHGTGTLRTHADLDPAIGLTAIDATLTAARDQDIQKIEVVAFLSGRFDPRDSETQKLLEQAVAMGVTHVGAVPCFYDHPDEVIDTLLCLARDLDVQVDVHLDEHLQSANSFSAHLASQTVQMKLHGRVTLSHGCAISTLPPGQRDDTIAAIADADIMVVSLPTTNLYLQDRTQTFPERRGMAPLRELLAKGVRVRLASDNVQDFFYPYGSADMLDVLGLGVTAGQIDDEIALARMVCGGHHRPEVGDAMEIILFPGTSIRDVLGSARQKRVVLR